MDEELAKKILKSIYEGKQPKHSDYDVSEEVWTSTASYLKKENYIKNIVISKNTQYLFAELTEKGRNFVKNEVLI